MYSIVYCLLFVQYCLNTLPSLCIFLRDISFDKQYLSVHKNFKNFEKKNFKFWKFFWKI